MKDMTQILGAAIFAGSLLISAAPSAMAQGFPSKPIEIIVPYAAGGGTDLSVRITAEIMQRHLPGSTIVVKNVTGGGGSIGTGQAVKAKPDGYTLGTGAQGPIALLPHYGGTTYKLEDVEFLGLMGRNLQVLLACKNAPFSTFEEFMAYARKNPGVVTIGNSGAGGANHLSVEAFAAKTGTKFENVPFGGASQALTACAGGHVHATTATPAEARPHVESGAAKPVFIMEEKRIAEFPDTPTAVEKGIDFTWSSWKGIIGPKGMPADVKAKLVKAIAATFKDPQFVAKMKEMGEFVDYRTPEGYAALARRDSQSAEQVIRNLGMYGMNAKKK